MHEICIPVPKLEEAQGADVEVMVGGKKKRFSFRVAAFHGKLKLFPLEIKLMLRKLQIQLWI